MRVRPYVLAGGRSSRMGRDKALLPLHGRTLLRRMVETLRSVPSLCDVSGNIVVTVLGNRPELEGADRQITDRFPGCGPLGGMEAALRDLDANGSADWALFVPVDMPFLPAGLIEALLQAWKKETSQGARVCYPEVDCRSQPLLSVIHKSVHPFIEEALTRGHFAVTPVLGSVCAVLAAGGGDSIAYGESTLCVTPLSLESADHGVAGWIATADEERSKRLWFSNLNSAEDFRDAETSAVPPGSSF